MQNELRGKIEDTRDGEANRLEVEHFLPEGDKVTVDFILRPVAEQSDTPPRLLALERDKGLTGRHEVKTAH